MEYSKLARDIKEKVNIVDIISLYVKDLKKRGKNYVALCPFHSEKTPSFTVSPEKQIFYCFGCNTGGDVIAFISKIEGISKFQALKKIAAMSGIKIDLDNYIEESPQEKEKKIIKEINLQATVLYHKLLKSSDGKKAMDFLKEKGIKEDSILNFMIGYAPDTDNFLYTELSKKYPKELLFKTSLFTVWLGKISDVFRNRIIIPIKSISGDIIGFGARTISDENPKYLNTQEDSIFSKRKVLFGIFNAIGSLRKERKAIIVEGYFDVILLHQYMLTTALSTMGTSFTKEHANILKNYIDEVVLMYDSDSAGINAAIKAADILVEEGIYPKIALLPQNTDPDEFLLNNGPDKMIELINTAPDIISFKINMIKSKNQMLTPEKKLKAIEFIAQTIVKQKNDIIKMEWIKNVSLTFDVDVGAITKLINKKSKEQANLKIQISHDTSKIPVIESDLIQIIIKKPSLIEKFPPNFSETYFESDITRKIFSCLRNNKPSDENTVEEILLANLPEYHNEIIRFTISAQDKDEEITNIENFNKTIKIIEKRYLEKEAKQIKAKKNLTSEELKKYNDIMIKIKNIKL